MIDPDALLAEFARSRSERVFRSLYDMVAPGMLGLAVRLAGGDRALADDVAQEAWLRAVDRLERFEAGRSAQRWLNGFVVNCWSERRRRNRREEPVEPAWFDRLPGGEEAVDWSDLDRVRRAVYALPDGYRTVLVLHDVEGFTHAEIAGYLSIEEGTSKSQLARARRQVRASLGGHDSPLRNDDARRV
ncbi:MAG TPA: RNA polymerase sigma factor [Gemmatimonadaceae bacterium]